MTLILLASLLALSSAVALVDWRRGWLMAIVCGVLQDPARKMTAGTPVVMTFSIVVVYAMILFAAQRTVRQSLSEVSQRFPRLYLTGVMFFFFLILAAITGLFTYGVALWKVPALSLFIYLAPIPAVLLGYAYMHREEGLVNFFRFYAVITSVALIGTVLEYMEVQFPALGLVALPGSYIRHIPGVQIRLLSGFYRAPDIMGWHAATLTAIAIYMALRGGLKARSWPWMLAAGWGFFNCMISGRRKGVYMVAVYAIVLIWRYFNRLKFSQIMALVLVGLTLTLVVREISTDEKSSVYARGASTTRGELTQRLEGGLFETVRQFGVMGAGLGTATQGVRHLLGSDTNVGWQEGGLGKLAIEVGIPGLIAAAVLAYVLFRTLFRISAFPDEPESSQLLRVALLAMVVANVVNFLASAQAYSDAVLTLLTAFFLGNLLGTTALSERTAPAPAKAPAMTPATAPA